MTGNVNTILADGIPPPIWCTYSGMDAGDRIADLRGQRGWSRPELARRMATTPQQLERLEKGQRRLTMDWLQRAAVALETDVTTLVADAD
ncbi:MAG: XRE family transcriptional regulator, partial [Zymomonas sp.]